jgi:hypothetical protein
MTLVARAAKLIERYPLVTRGLLLFIVFGLNIGGFARWYSNRRPGVALDLAIEAIRKHDSSAFNEVVNVDRLVSSYYDQHLLQGRPVPETTRALYIKAIGRRLCHWIDSGATETSYPRFDALVMFLRESADSGRWEVHDVNERSGSGAITLHNKANDSIEMKFKILRETGRWRLAELLNVTDVVDDVRNSEWRRLSPMLRIVNDAAVIVPPLPIDPVVKNDLITTYVGTVRVKKGHIEWAVCDLYSVGGKFVRTISAVTSPLDAGQEAKFSFQWRDCGEVTDCLPEVRWAQVSLNGKLVVLRPRALD